MENPPAMSAQKSIPQMLDEALGHHNAQRLEEASRRYREILARDPECPGALHLLGVIALQLKQVDQAIELIGRAIDVRPDSEAYHNNLGNALLAKGLREQAIDSYRKGVALNRNFVDGLVNLGSALRVKGEAVEAEAVLERAMALAPDNAAVLNNLANVLDTRGESDRAIGLYRRALELNGHYPEACRNLGRALFEKKRYDEAIGWLKRAIAEEPDNATAHVHLGLSLHRLGALDEALEHLKRATEIEPDNAEFLNNYGIVLAECGLVDEARDVYGRAVVAAPNSGVADCNLGILALKSGRNEDALNCFALALKKNTDTPGARNGTGVALTALGRFAESPRFFHEELHHYPDNAEAHMNLGMALLALGAFDEAWPHYEYRAQRKGFAAASGPKWQGEDLGHDTLLVYPEQGAGDNIQFLRYLPLLRKRYPDAKIAYPSPDALKRLFKHTLAAADVDVYAISQNVHTHGFQTALLSVPGLLATTLATIPADVPYLRVDPAWEDPWSQRLAGVHSPKIGLAWAGNPGYAGDRDRSIGFELIADLFDVPGISFISLQKPVDGEPPAHHPKLHDWMDDAADFADTAALIARLDLVISVDTSVAHLAGALGRPVWLLNRINTDWRWMLEREDSPWYPTMHIFRQSSRGDWKGVLRRVAQELARRYCGDHDQQ